MPSLITSPNVAQGIEKFNSADFYLPIDKYMSNVHKVHFLSYLLTLLVLITPDAGAWKVSRKGWDAPVTCRPNITLCELLNLVSAKKAHR